MATLAVTAVSVVYAREVIEGPARVLEEAVFGRNVRVEGTMVAGSLVMTAPCRYELDLKLESGRRVHVVVRQCAIPDTISDPHLPTPTVLVEGRLRGDHIDADSVRAKCRSRGGVT
jgi:hypothetical protein